MYRIRNSSKLKFVSINTCYKWPATQLCKIVEFLTAYVVCDASLNILILYGKFSNDTVYLHINFGNWVVVNYW